MIDDLQIRVNETRILISQWLLSSSRNIRNRIPKRITQLLLAFHLCCWT